MYTILALAVCLLAGFGLGRVKNKAKLKAVAAVLDNVESKAGQEAKSIIAGIRAKL